MIVAGYLLSRYFAFWAELCLGGDIILSSLLFGVSYSCFCSSCRDVGTRLTTVPDDITGDTSLSRALAADNVAVVFWEAVLSRLTTLMAATLELATRETGLESVVVVSRERQLQYLRGFQDCETSYLPNTDELANSLTSS